MIRINLLPKEERVSTRTFAFPKAASLAPLAALVAVAAIVGVTAALEHAKVAALRSDVGDLREEVRAIQPQVDRVKKLTAQREELERRLDVIRQLDEGRFLSVRVMDDMSREVPKYMWLTNVNQQGAGKVTVNGITFSNLIVADYMKRLERSSMFSGVDLATAERGEIDGRTVVKFAVSANLTPDELPDDFSAEAIAPVTREEEN